MENDRKPSRGSRLQVLHDMMNDRNYSVKRAAEDRERNCYRPADPITEDDADDDDEIYHCTCAQ